MNKQPVRRLLPLPTSGDDPGQPPPGDSPLVQTGPLELFGALSLPVAAPFLAARLSGRTVGWRS